MKERTRRKIGLYLNRIFEYLVYGHVLSAEERRRSYERDVRRYTNNV